MTEIILSAFPRPGATVEWRDIAAAVDASGVAVKDWLREVRGPLQALLDAGTVLRDSSSTAHERYVLAPTVRSVRGVRVTDARLGHGKVLKAALADEPLVLVRWHGFTAWHRVDPAWQVEGAVALAAAFRP